MKRNFIQIQGSPGIPLILGDRAVIFHRKGYLRTGTVKSMYRSPTGAYLLATADTVYWITSDITPSAAQSAHSLCA